MKVYLTYKFKDEELGNLRGMLEQFSKLIEESTGWKTFIFFRDVQKWQKPSMDVKEVIEKAMKEINKCDAILAEASEKARGVTSSKYPHNSISQKLCPVYGVQITPLPEFYLATLPSPCPLPWGEGKQGKDLREARASSISSIYFWREILATLILESRCISRISF